MPNARDRQTEGTVEQPDHDAILASYTSWLARQPLARRTRTTYQRRVSQFLAWLATSEALGDAFGDCNARDYAARDFKAHLKSDRKAAPASVNLSLAAIDHFYRFVGLGPALVRREDLPGVAPRALSVDEQRRLLRAAERGGSVRNAAVVHLFLFGGLRIGELSALELDDVLVSARKGKVIVRSGKGDAYREVPLNAVTRTAVSAWLDQRRNVVGSTSALFVTRQGKALSERAVDLVVRNLGADAGLDLSAHVLRHSFCTNLVRDGADLVLVAELAGHRRLETTRRYSLPSAADRQAAVEALTIEY
ncbi:MAG: tyrosine-type recombinase/integrase [Actinomycetota bacterium]|nr:tyrosine-type recombinase/integrase [Actinomycetota bacterium]MDQ6947570.1 tyrosine-type recombinase/integrase [Actinomycetota bacterium]